MNGFVRFVGFVGALAFPELHAQQATFRAPTDVVSVAVSVMKGREPVTGLGAADFELTDNGVRQAVDAVSLEHVPIDVTLVLTTGAVNFPGKPTDDQLRGFLGAEATRKLLLPADRLRGVWVHDEIRGALVGSDYTVLSDPMVKASPSVLSIVDGVSAWSHRGWWGIALVDGLFYALAWPVDADRRHLVVAFTDGRDLGSTLEADALPKLAARSDAVLHAVLWATPNDGPASGLYYREWQASYRAVDQAVQRTGGTLRRTGQSEAWLRSSRTSAAVTFCVIRRAVRRLPAGTSCRSRSHDPDRSRFARGRGTKADERIARYLVPLKPRFASAA